MKRTIIFIIFLSCLGCKYFNKDKGIATATSQSNSFKDSKVDSSSNEEDLKQKSVEEKSFNQAYDKLDCDSLMILLIKSSSIDKLALNERAGIDSIKKGVIYLTFSVINKENGTEHNLHNLEVDLNKRELKMITDTFELLTYNRQLLNRIIDKKCYNGDVDYVTAPQ